MDDERMNLIKIITIIIFAFIGWAACGATMGIGMALTTLEFTLIIHAIGAPIYFIILSMLYFRKFNYTNPLTTATIFIAFVIFVDFILVALIINKSFDMFRSFIGTWLPFILIFVSTWLTGKIVVGSPSPALRSDNISEVQSKSAI
ncbi:hypothetical protein ACFL9T_04285 [Thermodesulfobacteriota bacterium]